MQAELVLRYPLSDWACFSRRPFGLFADGPFLSLCPRFCLSVLAYRHYSLLGPELEGSRAGVRIFSNAVKGKERQTSRGERREAAGPVA